MYAENFFIARYDEQAHMIHWEYVIDEKDQGKSIWQPQPLNDENKTGTAYVIRSGKMIRVQDFEQLMFSFWSHPERLQVQQIIKYF